MKKLILVLLSLTILSGCGFEKVDNTSPVEKSSMIVDEEKTAYIGDTDCHTNKTKVVENIIDDIYKLKKSDITLTEKDYHEVNNSIVNVYINDKLNLLIAKREADNSNFYEIYNKIDQYPEKYVDVLNKISEKYMRYSDGVINGQYDRLDFENDEYIICNPDKPTIFSICYNNVYANINNVPVKIIAYIKDNKAAKLHIIGLDIAYCNKKLTGKNIESIENALSVLGVENTEGIIKEFDNYMTDKKVNDKIGEYKINCRNNVVISDENKEIIQKDMIVEIK